ncbi:hypothetical protein EV714DRAFT_278159 [Schizophyllum commune]
MAARNFDEPVVMTLSCRLSTVSGERRRPSSSSSESLGLGTIQDQILQLRPSTLLTALSFLPERRVEGPRAAHWSRRASNFLEQLTYHVEHESLYFLEQASKVLEQLVDHVQRQMSKALEQLTGYIERLLTENIESDLPLCTPLYIAIGCRSRHGGAFISLKTFCRVLICDIEEVVEGLMYARSLSLRYLLDAPVKILVNKRPRTTLSPRHRSSPSLSVEFPSHPSPKYKSP